MPPITRALVLQHVDIEGPERIADICQELGLAVQTLPLHQGAPAPAHPPDDALLVVMGGPMNVSDRSDPAYPFLDLEIALLRSALASKAPVLGVCLGAQLLAHAAGGSVHPNLAPDARGKLTPRLELGWGPITLHGRDTEPAFAGLPEWMTVLHWHGEVFELPPDAVCLASSPVCPNQAFRLGDRAYGLQFHIEVGEQTVARWAYDDTDFVRQALGPNGVERLIADNARQAPRAFPACDLLLHNILGCLTGRSK